MQGASHQNVISIPTVPSITYQCNMMYNLENAGKYNKGTLWYIWKFQFFHSNYSKGVLRIKESSICYGGFF